MSKDNRKKGDLYTTVKRLSAIQDGLSKTAGKTDEKSRATHKQLTVEMNEILKSIPSGQRDRVMGEVQVHNLRKKHRQAMRNKNLSAEQKKQMTAEYKQAVKATLSKIGGSHGGKSSASVGSSGH